MSASLAGAKSPLRKRALHWLGDNAGPAAAALVIRMLRLSIRLRVHGRETIERYAREGTRYIHVFWHAHLLMMVYSYVGPRLVFMISQHRDGELIARTVERFGYAPARGSSTRGAVPALREMLREIERGSDIGFTPDGPRGPSRVVQAGTIAAAQITGAPVVPVAIGVTRAWRLRTWDRFVVPKPGARALLAYGEPMSFSREEPIEDGCRRLESAMRALEDFAERHAADTTIGRPV